MYSFKDVMPSKGREFFYYNGNSGFNSYKRIHNTQTLRTVLVSHIVRPILESRYNAYEVMTDAQTQVLIMKLTADPIQISVLQLLKCLIVYW